MANIESSGRRDAEQPGPTYHDDLVFPQSGFVINSVIRHSDSVI
ncbi:MAG TPA: hypothetical protein VH229_12145 [Candidatus Udaeobacter sp.]|nr:hypothetical protein [Candidatus Udaeobacter sp.]